MSKKPRNPKAGAKVVPSTTADHVADHVALSDQRQVMRKGKTARDRAKKRRQ